jgi:uncharacterized cofD-like protein
VPDLAQAVRASRALKIYLCNITTQPGETDNFSCRDHLLALEDHLGKNFFDIIVINNKMEGKLPDQVKWVTVDPKLEQEYPVYFSDLQDNMTPWFHNSQKLAQVIKDLYQQRTGPLVE